MSCIIFFFNDTATTEIYTYDTLFPYTTLFRSPLAQRKLCRPEALALRAEAVDRPPADDKGGMGGARSEEHTSELQSLMRISYAVFCLKKKRYKPLLCISYSAQLYIILNLHILTT